LPLTDLSDFLNESERCRNGLVMSATTAIVDFGPAAPAGGGSVSGRTRPNPATSGAVRMNEDQSRDVIARAQKGDEAAFQVLFREHRETVARVVHRVMGPSSELDDVVQEVFVQVFRSIGSFRGDSKFTTWLYRLTANVTKMHLRKKKSRPRFAEVSAERLLEGESTDDPGESVARNERVTALYRLVDGLTEKKREVLVLHDFQGWTAARIAENVGIPVLTVRTRLFYARKELYAALADDEVLAPVVKSLMHRLPGGAKKSASKTVKAKEKLMAEAGQ
jgi:RNA polymerase sigma-70 factor (ECF subfamily)